MSIMIIFNLSSAKSQQHLRMVFPGGHPTSLIGRECDEYVIEGSVFKYTICILYMKVIYNQIYTNNYSIISTLKAARI